MFRAPLLVRRLRVVALVIFAAAALANEQESTKHPLNVERWTLNVERFFHSHNRFR